VREYLLVHVNGQRCEIRGDAAFSALTDFLRRELQLTGTKVVCAEGDCGACTVLVGQPDDRGLRYETVDSCIQFLYQLDSKHVVTVEGLQGPARIDDRGSLNQLHPVQQAMVNCHGSQCGYCTPGFVMALAGFFEHHAAGRPADAGECHVERSTLQTALTGNLCRCTGYLPILDAGLAVDCTSLPALAQHYSSQEMLDELRRHAADSVLLKTQQPTPSPSHPHQDKEAGSERTRGRTYFAPLRLEEAVDFKASHPEAVIVSGGTELGVLRNKKGFDPPTLLSLARVPGLAAIAWTPEGLSIGANVTWTQIEQFVEALLQNPLRNGQLPPEAGSRNLSSGFLAEFHRLILRFGSPQIRNVSTLVANVAHGSPIADSLPLLCVLNAEVEMTGRAGTRRVPINGFYKGYKIKDLRADEIITCIVLPLPGPEDLVKLYKISRRTDLDIATFGAAIRLETAAARITRAHVAYSGVGPTVVRLPAAEAMLHGQPLTEATFRQAGRAARGEIQPISDVRGSRDFRLLLAENIMVKFYFDAVLGKE
jgi:xanthine dehydrogenase small subunit